MAENTKKKLSRGMKALISVGTILVLLASALLIYYFGHSHKEFNEMSSKEFAIPGLSDGFVPQGMCFASDANKYLVSGYMGDSSASRIYVVDNETKKCEKFFTLTGISEEMQKGHLGGIANSGNFVWIATENHILTITLDQINNVNQGESVSVLSTLLTPTEASFCYADERTLWVGEFYRDGTYKTDEAHHYQINENEKNYAIAVSYDINTLNTSGIDEIPTKVLSLPNQVQGFAITNSNKIVLSTSYSIPDSQILIYKDVLSQEPQAQIVLDSQEFPLYVLDKANLSRTIIAPSMSEGLDYVDGEVKILFESACNKYKFVTRNRMYDVMSIALE